MTADLVAFLRQRLDEDEAFARAATPATWRYNPRKQWESPKTFGTPQAPAEEYVAAGPLDDPVCIAVTGPADDVQSMVDARHIARHDPARVLADVQAKRQIIKRFERACYQADHDTEEFRDVWDEIAGTLEQTLIGLAIVFSDHPDFNPAWRL